MPRGLVNRSLGAAARRVPGLKRLPAAKLLVAAELGLMAREHLAQLSPGERRRLFELVRIGRGRRQNLSEHERDELSALIAKMEPRLFAGEAIDRLSPLPLPGRLVYGRGSRRAAANGR